MEIDEIDKNLDRSQNVSSSDEAAPQDASHYLAKLDNMDNLPGCSSHDRKEHNSKHHSNNCKKVIKHALRQQAKRRRKNTTIAAGNSAPVPRIIVKPLPPQPVEEVIAAVPVVVTLKAPQTTMKEVLASIPGFNIKPRKRTNKKLSTAAQLEQTKEGCIDLETPDSILVNTNLRSLLNKYTFAVLPALYQHKLVQLLPAVDRPPVTGCSDVATRLSASGLNNEFFARACLEWQERLAEGEFTPENQQKLKSESDKERSRLDPWKLKHFEPIWGERIQGGDTGPVKEPSPPPRPPIKTTIKLRPTTSISNKSKPAPFIKRLRTVGAVTRSCTSYKVELEASNQLETTTRSPIPDLLPIKTHKSQIQKPIKDNMAAVAKPILNRVGHEMGVESLAPDCKELASSNSRDVQEPIINISDTVMVTNEETIISCRENNNKVDKRRRSLSSESEQRSPKRKTPSPIRNSPHRMEDSTSNPSWMDDKPDNAGTIVTATIEVITNHDITTTEEDHDPEEEINDETMDTYSENLDQQDHDQEPLPEPIQHQEETITMEIDKTTDDLTLEPLESLDPEEEEDEKSDESESGLDVEPEPTSNENSPIEHQPPQEAAPTPQPDDTCKISDQITSPCLSPPGSPDLKTQESPESAEEQPQFEDDNKPESPAETPNSPPKTIVERETTKEYSPETPTEVDAEESKSDSPSLELEPSNLSEPFEILPNSLILQQEAIVLEKTCPENCGIEVCMEESAEKLEASVEESDLVRDISEDDDANEDRFIDAENYVLESGQIEVAVPQKPDKEVLPPPDLHTALFAATRGSDSQLIQAFFRSLIAEGELLDHGFAKEQSTDYLFIEKVESAEQSEDLMEMLIAFVEQRPALYDFTLPSEERTTTKKDILWKEIYGLMEGRISLSELPSKWKSLRDRYLRLKGVYKLPASPAAPSGPVWKYFNLMKFVDRRHELLQATSSLSVDVVACSDISGPSSSPTECKQAFEIKQADEDVGERFSTALERLNLQEVDETDLFALILASGLKRLPVQKRSKLEINFLQQLYTAEFEDEF